MTKLNQNFTFWTGEDKNLVYAVTDSDSASVLVTGFNTVDWKLFDEPGGASLIRYVSGGSGVTLSGCTCTVALAASDTGGCSINGTYWTQLSACDGDGKSDVLAVGWATIHQKG